MDNNRRNGSYEKKIIDGDSHKLKVEVSRDRAGEYNPQLILKGLRRCNGFGEKVISLYGRGMTVNEIRGHLEEIYQTEVSGDLLSTITDGVLEEVSRWQNRVVYPILRVACLKLQYFAIKWDKKYQVISDIWWRDWSGIIPFFAFPAEIKKVIYATNTIESVNRQIRKIIKNKGIFPDDESIQKIIFLSLQNAAKKWTMPNDAPRSRATRYLSKKL